MRKILNVTFNSPSFSPNDLEECPKLTSLVENGWNIVSSKRIYDLSQVDEQLKTDYSAEFQIVLAK